MIYIKEIQDVVNKAYIALAEVQYLISVKEPISGDVRFFDSMYTLSTKLVANLEYIDMMDLGHSYAENTEIENILYSITEIISKIKTTWG